MWCRGVVGPLKSFCFTVSTFDSPNPCRAGYGVSFLFLPWVFCFRREVFNIAVTVVGHRIFFSSKHLGTVRIDSSAHSTHDIEVRIETFDSTKRKQPRWLARNITPACDVTIYITLHYITLHILERFWNYFRLHIFSRLYNLPPRQAFCLQKAWLVGNNNIGWAKAHSKTGFSVNDWKSSRTLRRLKRISRCTRRVTLISVWGKLFSKWEN